MVENSRAIFADTLVALSRTLSDLSIPINRSIRQQSLLLLEEVLQFSVCRRHASVKPVASSVTQQFTSLGIGLTHVVMFKSSRTTIVQINQG